MQSNVGRGPFGGRKRPGVVKRISLGGIAGLAAGSCALLLFVAGSQALGLTSPSGEKNLSERASQGPSQDVLQLVGMDHRRAAHILRKLPNPVAVCLPLSSGDRDNAARQELGQLLETLSKSATARILLRIATARNALLCLDDATDRFAYYYAHMRLIGVNARIDEGRRIAFLAHELAHVPQHPAYSDNRHFPPRDLVLLRRIREAAAEAQATQILWELWQAGYRKAWDAKLKTLYRDIARAYEAVVRDNGGREGQLAAARVSFDQWFMKQRRLELYDGMTLDHLRRISEDDLGLVPPARFLSHGFLRAIGWIGQGNYLSQRDDLDLTTGLYRTQMSVTNAARMADIMRKHPSLASSENAPARPRSFGSL